MKNGQETLALGDIVPRDLQLQNQHVLKEGKLKTRPSCCPGTLGGHEALKA